MSTVAGARVASAGEPPLSIEVVELLAKVNSGLGGQVFAAPDAASAACSLVGQAVHTGQMFGQRGKDHRRDVRCGAHCTASGMR
ncbi:hypothetical protein ACH41H_29030 [Streptomyces sp. NPDC020800]|uniref:hypothetical protein n=1 Tax=Streptomyces sp. NPDC020800 TaxID=3365092 RepID=UPI00378D5A0B